MGSEQAPPLAIKSPPGSSTMACPVDAAQPTAALPPPPPVAPCPPTPYLATAANGAAAAAAPQAPPTAAAQPQQAAAAMEHTQAHPPPIIAFSLKARGLAITPAIPRDRRRLLPELGQSLLDLSIAISVQIVLLSWSTWVSVLLVVLCCVFYANYKDGAMAAADGAIMVPVALLIYAPCLAQVYQAAQRRWQAQRHLDAVQAHVLAIYTLHSSLGGCGAPELLAQLDDALSDTMAQLQGYLSAPRSLSSLHFGTWLLSEQPPAKSRVYALSMGMAHQLRQVHACMRRLAAVGSGLLAHCSSPSDGAGSASCAQQQCSQQALALAQQLVPLTRSLQALLAIKDLHTPLLLRAMLRPAVVLVSPLLSGSFLAGAGLIGRPVTAAGQVFAIVVGCILQIMLMSLYTLGTQLEDPFDTGPDAPPDALSLLEFMHTLAYLTAPPGSDDDQERSDADAATGLAEAQLSSGEVSVDVQHVAGLARKAAPGRRRSRGGGGGGASEA